jgi:hypothetical protein
MKPCTNVMSPMATRMATRFLSMMPAIFCHMVFADNQSFGPFSFWGCEAKKIT